MKQYYFYAPSQYRKENRAAGCIDFKLKALYAEKVFSTARGREEYRFNYIDSVAVAVSTTEKSLFNFDVDTGKDGCTGHWAKKEAELIADKKHWGYRLITEAQYLCLRKLAITLLFRHTESLAMPAAGDQKYFYARSYAYGFWDIRLVALNYIYNSKNYDAAFLKYLADNKMPLNDVTVPEEIKIFILKPKKETERPGQCANFHIKGNEHYCRHESFEAAAKRLYVSSENYREITRGQYERLRSICKYLMYESCALDLSRVKKTQDYAVRMLDAW